MGNIDKLFSEADRERVNQAVREAESATSAEILPVVAKSSGRYDRPEDIVGLWFTLTAMILVWYLYPTPMVEPGNWAVPSVVWQILTWLVAMIAGFIAGAVIAGRFDWLRRLFTPRAQMRDEVYSRARQVYFDKRVHHTQGGSGVLLYVSLFERMAAVIADQTILEKLGQSEMDRLCVQFTEKLRQKNPVDAFCDMAQLLGNQLAPLLPRDAGDVNELADALVVIS